MLNSGEPSEPPSSRRASSHEPKAKSKRAQRQSEGIVGWGNYFGTGNASKHFNNIDGYVWKRLMGLRVTRKGRHLKPGEVEKRDRAYFEALGLYRLRGTLKYPETPFWEAA